MLSPRLDHVNIQTEDLAGTVRFFADVLELEAADPPAPLDPACFCWMRDGQGAAIFHLALRGVQPDAGAGNGTGPVHHVALACTGHDAMAAKLDRLGLRYRRNTVDGADVQQIFVRDPNGVLLELNFRGERAVATDGRPQAGLRPAGDRDEAGRTR